MPCIGAGPFQSTLPLRGATLASDDERDLWSISIHAPLTGSDDRLFLSFYDLRISIHAPLTGSDWIEGVNDDLPDLISIHAPLTGSDHFKTTCSLSQEISIHAPLTGSDLDRLFHIFDILFQSTLPLRGATSRHFCWRTLEWISIHAPLTGSDCDGEVYRNATDNFNPRSPYGERQHRDMRRCKKLLFQSTLPLRGATILSSKVNKRENGFQSTLPLRGATTPTPVCGCPCWISIHAPLTGSDLRDVAEMRYVQISIHAPLTGSDLPGVYL